MRSFALMFVGVFSIVIMVALMAPALAQEKVIKWKVQGFVPAGMLYHETLQRTAEEVKIQIGAALPLEREMQMDVRGRDLIAGLPRSPSLDNPVASVARARDRRAYVLRRMVETGKIDPAARDAELALTCLDAARAIGATPSA